MVVSAVLASGGAACAWILMRNRPRPGDYPDGGT
jgi:hypothetical protein